MLIQLVTSLIPARTTRTTRTKRNGTKILALIYLNSENRLNGSWRVLLLVNITNARSTRLLLLFLLTSNILLELGKDRYVMLLQLRFIVKKLCNVRGNFKLFFVTQGFTENQSAYCNFRSLFLSVLLSVCQPSQSLQTSSRYFSDSLVDKR